ncbi:hypothetical protein GGI21_001741 [Coemansia aciculifera]|uniref:Uncharacterized protein n=1 Tax=Coemansia aciculifera TaxID=417176 RepID=A0ACC1LUG1_9FUNG|nr:hypothetical protein IWW38_006183 [Coemansia aciculifera]KAJ2909576.1 hypothetical protein GGI21_001741 [Coemansia aciculifera]
MAASDAERDVTEKFENAKLSSENEAEEEEEEDNDEVYVVEKIIGHRNENGGQLFHIKWAGYPESENTWEEEGNVLDKDMLAKYWDEKRIEKAKREATKKRNTLATAKMAKTRDQSPDSAAANKRRRTLTPTSARAPGSDAGDYEASGPDDDNWEPLIKEIETVDRKEKDKLIVFIEWKNGQVTSHPIELAYQKCPQAMLKFYEERLRFRTKK